MPELSPEQKNAISWTICCTNAFVMLTSGLVIDINKVWEYVNNRRGFKWGILLGLFGQLIMIPCLGYIAITIGKLDNAISLAVIIQGCCPGSAVLNLFSAFCDGTPILAQTLTSVGTFMALGLMPLYLKIYSSFIMDPSACQDGVCPEIPYGPICRTLSILLLGLSCGIIIRYLTVRYEKSLRILKMFVKFGTVIGFLVIVTFILLYAIYFTWDFGTEVWIITVVMPICGYSIGYFIANVWFWLLTYFATRRNSSYAQQALKNFTGSECRTIGLACGLQNTQLGMSTVFGAYALNDFLIEKMHPYSPLYGFMELVYSFIISGVFYAVEKFYFKEVTPGPRIVDIWAQKVQDEPEMYVGMSGIINALQRLPASFRRRNRLGTTIEEDTFEPETLDFDKLHTVTSYYELTNDYTSLSDQGKATIDRLFNWKKRFPDVKIDDETEQYVRHRKSSSTYEAAISRPSHSTDFSKASTKKGRFEVTELTHTGECQLETMAEQNSSSPECSSSSSLPGYEPYDQEDHIEPETSSSLPKTTKKTLVKSSSVQPVSLAAKKPISTQLSSPEGILSRFVISTVDDVVSKTKDSQIQNISENSRSGSIQTPSRHRDENETKALVNPLRISPDTSTEDDDVFTIENVVEGQSDV